MTAVRSPIHGQWSSRLAFILAATGSAVGLGNIWKFPYTAGENGGGAFVLVYLLCVALIGIPVMISEVLLGRRGRRSPINTMRELAGEERAPGPWFLLGWLGVVAGVLILSFYSVIAGWALGYLVRAASGAFTGIDAEGSAAMFAGLIGDPERLLAWHTVFMVLTVVIVARGVKSGLERAVTIMMPALLLIMVGLFVYAMGTPGFSEGVNYLFAFDMSAIVNRPETVLDAMGQAFFTLSLGMGAIMIYGSYLPKQASIPQTVVVIALADTLVALLAGMVIFPIVFSNGLAPGSGPGLVFETLPLAFGQMDFGVAIASAFFLLLALAALTSAISIIEPLVAWLVENRGMSRVLAAATAGIVIWLLGIGSLLSFNILAEYTVFFGRTFFDALDFLTSNIMLPLGGLLIALFAAWMMSRSSTEEELAVTERTRGAYNVWRFLVRYVTPVGVGLVLLYGLIQ